MKCPLEFPAEYWVDLVGHPHLIGRITILKIGTSFNAELDLMLKDSRKIFRHIDMLYKISSFDEALDLAYQRFGEKMRAPQVKEHNPKAE